MAYPNYTVAPSGGDFTTLQGAVNDLITNHPTPASAVTITISGTWSTKDTTAVNITSALTLTATNTLTITATGAARATDSWYTSGIYILNVTPTTTSITVGASYVIIDGITVEIDANGHSQNGITLTSYSTVKNCVLYAPVSQGDGGNVGITAGTNALIYNNIIFQVLYSHNGSYGGIGISGNDSTNKIYNNTVYKCGTGISAAAADVKNNISMGNITSDFGGTYTNADYNLSSDATAPGTHSLTSKTSSSQFASISSGSENFALTSTADAIGAGTSESGTFTTDISGTTRTTPWDMGAVKWSGYPSYSVAPSGGNFTTLAGAISDLQTNYATLTSPVTITISGTWSSADTTAVNFTGITTSSTNTITVTATGTARTDGTLTKSGEYILEPSVTGNALTISIDNVIIDGIALSGASLSGTANAIIGTGNSGTIKNCTVANSGNTLGLGISLDLGSGKTVYIYNNVVYNVNGSAISQWAGSNHDNVYVWNNTIYKFSMGGTGTNGRYNYGIALFNPYTGFASEAKNNLVIGTTSGIECFGVSGSAITIATNGSSDLTGTSGLTSLTTSEFTNVTSGSENLSLASGATSIGAGTDLSATFTTDITGATRTVPWDIGAFKYTVASTNITIGAPPYAYATDGTNLVIII